MRPGSPATTTASCRRRRSSGMQFGVHPKSYAAGRHRNLRARGRRGDQPELLHQGGQHRDALLPPLQRAHAHGLASPDHDRRLDGHGRRLGRRQEERRHRHPGAGFRDHVAVGAAPRPEHAAGPDHPARERGHRLQADRTSRSSSTSITSTPPTEPILREVWINVWFMPEAEVAARAPAARADRRARRHGGPAGRDAQARPTAARSRTRA